ncbi:MAG: hypothetical protein RL518_230 [Pseudomonadota bacterium]|jgi:hypothetical protein
MAEKTACREYRSAGPYHSGRVTVHRSTIEARIPFGTVVAMNREKRPTKDDVARLTRGKPSRTRVGSRQIRHRLRNDELDRLAVARSRGYLTVTPTTRAALQNAWHLDRLAALKPCLFVQHTANGYILFGEKNTLPIKVTVTSLKEVEESVRNIARLGPVAQS